MASFYHLMGVREDDFHLSHRFVTSWLLPPLLLAVLRGTIAVYAFTAIFFKLGWQGTHGLADANDSDLSYFTNLTFWGIAFYFLFSAIHTYLYACRGYAPLDLWPRLLQALHSLFYTTVVTFPFLVTIVFWVLLYDGPWFPVDFDAWSNITFHALNAIFCTFELSLPATNPPPWLHLVFLILILALYLALAYLTYETEGFYTYNFLNPATGRGRVAIYCAGILAAIIVVFMVVWFLIWVRKRFTRTGKKSRADMSNARCLRSTSRAIRSNAEEKNTLMSLRPESGEEEAREDNDLNLQRHLEAGVEAQGASSNASSDSDFIRDDLDLENGVPALNKQVISQEEEIRSVASLQENRTQDPSVQLVEGPQSADGTSSIADDTPSLQESVQSSSPSGAYPLRPPGSRITSTTARRPFDRRFQSRLSPSPLNSPRAISPAFLSTHSRQSSLASIGFQSLPDPDSTSAPWDVIRWTKLRKLTGQVFSEVGRRNFGRSTCLAVSTSIVVGTSKGIVLLFDYQQNAKGIIGLGTKAIECGSVTSLAISEDSTTIAVGHAEGHIFTWELAKSTRPFLHIPPLDAHPAESRKVEGHLAGVPVIHIGFLGFRHTALVSADNRGMAFSHLATRGMGSVGRAVRTTRVLGRYPDVLQRGHNSRKSSSVLAFSTLPFGNMEQATNELGLVAIMTPYLLVIVSTTPTAQTQHKAARPKEIAAHSAMTAALAWFPALKLKAQDAAISRTKLVYCWSNVLTVLEVIEVEPSEPGKKEKPLELLFKARSRWRSQEAIVAVQWLSRSVMAILTVTQQLIILEDVSMNPTDSFDLVQKQLYHSDLFSQQLHSLVEQLDEEDSSMHGVVADAFYMSFHAYKSRLFVLGFNDLSIGSLSNWADRLLAMLEAGDFIGAIQLATSYYAGIGEKTTIGLPEDDRSRHGVVKEKLVEMISASLKYAFGHNQQAGTEQLDDSQLNKLAIACITATLSIKDTSFLFDEVFAWYDDHDKATIFLEVLEPYIIDGQITSIPPLALKPLIDHYMTTHTAESLEEIICRLDTSTMDIDRVTTLCKRYNLYDAFIYVWTRALGDYLGPCEELLNLSLASSQSNGHTEASNQAQLNAVKIFPYLSFTLTSRVYPTGEELSFEEARTAKEQIYGFFFSGALDHVSRGSSSTKTCRSFPHLRKFLSLDTASSMSVLNEAFEDSYLNRPDEISNGLNTDLRLDATSQPKSFTRQFIISVLLEVMSSADLEPEDSIFVDMFIARSLPKYPQDLVLSGSTLDQILTRMCHYPNEDSADDCQLSVEYLLSVYHPPNIQSLVPLFKEARFFRVLKSVYRSEHQWSLLVQVYFLDEQDQAGVFEVIRACLRQGSSLSSKERQAVQAVVKSHALDLAKIDVTRTSLLVADCFAESHGLFLSSLAVAPNLQYRYLNSLLEPQGRGPPNAGSSASLTGLYIQLMCQQNPLHVTDYVKSLTDVDLQLRDVLPQMEASGVIDAAVMLMARQGQVQDAMKRLIKYLSSLEGTLTGIMRNLEGSPDVASTKEAIHDLLQSVEKYSAVGIWLCQRQTTATQRSRPVLPASKRSNTVSRTLSFEETLWLQLINSVVDIAKDLTRPEAANRAETDGFVDPGSEIASTLRLVVQNVFTALLKATTASRKGSGDRHDLAFLQILRAFLTQAAASSPSLAELRAVISSIFSAYAYEESLLALSNSMLDKDLFVHVDEIAKLRRRGWRPRGQICEICRRRVWGPGAGAQIWEAWLRKEDRKIQQSQGEEHLAAQEERASASRGKGKATEELSVTAASQSEAVDGGEMSVDAGLGPALIFACRHLFHQTCLDHQLGQASGSSPSQGHEHLERVCPVCPRST